MQVLPAIDAGLQHPRPQQLDDPQRLVVADASQWPPRVDLGEKAAFRLPEVADAGDRALVEQRVANRARRVVVAQPPQEFVTVERRREDVGSELGEATVETPPRLGEQLEQRSVELNHGRMLAAQHEPRSPRRSLPALAIGMDAPGAGHPQVRMDAEIAFEAEEKVLAVCTHLFDDAASEALGPAIGREAGMRRLDHVRRDALDDGADPVRGVTDRVALRHQAAIPVLRRCHAVTSPTGPE